MFEDRLLKNVRAALGGNLKRVYKRYGRLICELDKGSNLTLIKEVLQKLPGIAYFSFAHRAALDIEKIKSRILEILGEKKFKTFKIFAKRSYKEFPLTSLEINKVLGELVIEKLRKKVDVVAPQLRVWVEICEKEAFIYTERYGGIDGLPTSTGGTILSLLSGGIDSPVASFLMMKRGCRVVFLHFFNRAIIAPGSLAKIENIVKALTAFQLRSKLYLIPFEEIQKEIIKSIPSRYRMIIYRRFMTAIANRLAGAERAEGIVTGDSIGQVASQTLRNLSCIYQAAQLPIFTPLIGINKNEIVELAKEIGTYRLSILPYNDCCSFMIAKHPETGAELSSILRLEGAIEGREKLIQSSISNSNIKFFKYGKPKR
jgi:thiamine biosynthesis protein ThiI